MLVLKCSLKLPIPCQTSDDAVTEALQQAGLESSNLIVGIDFTKSNKWTGKYSFNGCCLHDTGATWNPYEQAISIIGRTLSRFDEDNLIPCFGFGDGPTSFAPIIEMAMSIVEQSGGQYHILLIIADGQVTRSENSESGRLSYQEQKTVEAIVKASNRAAISLKRTPLPPPNGSYAAAFYGSDTFRSTSFQQNLLHFPRHNSICASAPPAASVVSRNRICSACSMNLKDMVFDCGHQVTEALAQAGLESSNLIVGIDFTKSNEWTGKLSFHGRSLHHIGDISNPYEQAISIIGKTLSAFDEDNLIPCFGFGDASTHDQDVFSFYPDERSCNGFTEALARYRELVPRLRLAGPTSFAPIIEMAMTIVEQNGGQYHVLLIIADGQVTRSVDTEFGQLSSQEQMTVDAIVKASEFPLSIVLVGVGDGPWDMMKEFDDNIPARAFDNFQFVNFMEIMSKNMPQTRKEAAFALAALMEIPSQYKATLELGILGRCSAKSPERVPLPPPIGGYGTSSSGSKTFQKNSFQKSAPPYSGYDTTPRRAPTAPSASLDNQVDKGYANYIPTRFSLQNYIAMCFSLLHRNIPVSYC
ncbi:hypothetical protein COCNU_11G001810 [Cocos nucifera]|uniref:VWFA domain-containing protein n=1 Tax=Cocos nucifera TaxID=13894 RepID=A0A8K0IND4_COCNU|nr:hypothetical protein COCNU_11G001810 [Cocos nucifera]